MPGDKIVISDVSEEFNKNFDDIDWGGLKEKPNEKPKNKKSVSAGLCGEFGMSVFDKKSFDENFDRIDWGKNEKN